MMWMSCRHRAAEWMDEFDADPAQVEKSLRFIQKINRVLGYTRATISHLETFSRNWKPGETISIIDLATGSADVPRAIVKWGAARGFDVRVVGLDLHPLISRIAAKNSADRRIQIVRGDVLHPPFENESFDYAINSMFMHHLAEDDVVAAMKVMSRLCRRGMIVADLLRTRRAYLWVKLFSLLSNPMVRHDALASVAQAFTRSEILALRDRAGLDFLEFYQHPAHRFVLAGEKTHGSRATY